MDIMFSDRARSDPWDAYSARERIQALAAGMLERERWPRERSLKYQRNRLREIAQHMIACFAITASIAKQ